MQCAFSNNLLLCSFCCCPQSVLESKQREEHQQKIVFKLNWKKTHHNQAIFKEIGELKVVKAKLLLFCGSQKEAPCEKITTAQVLTPPYP